MTATATPSTSTESTGSRFERSVGVLNKFFLISLGGSGEKLARYLRQDLEQGLYNSGWKEGVPRAFRWLCFDVARTSDVVVKDVPEDLGARNGKRIGLADDE